MTVHQTSYAEKKQRLELLLASAGAVPVTPSAIIEGISRLDQQERDMLIKKITASQNKKNTSVYNLARSALAVTSLSLAVTFFIGFSSHKAIAQHSRHPHVINLDVSKLLQELQQTDGVPWPAHYLLRQDTHE